MGLDDGRDTAASALPTPAEAWTGGSPAVHPGSLSDPTTKAACTRRVHLVALHLAYGASPQGPQAPQRPPFTHLVSLVFRYSTAPFAVLNLSYTLYPARGNRPVGLLSRPGRVSPRPFLLRCAARCPISPAFPLVRWPFPVCRLCAVKDPIRYSCLLRERKRGPAVFRELRPCSLFLGHGSPTASHLYHQPSTLGHGSQLPSFVLVLPQSLLAARGPPIEPPRHLLLV